MKGSTKFTNCARTLLLCTIPTLSPTPALAHHSHAEFVGEPQLIAGEITQVTWNNPHPAMVMKADISGQERILRVQVLGNVNGLRRDGVTGNEFYSGQPIKLTAQFSERRDGLILATAAELVDGTKLALGPYTSEEGAIYGSGTATTDLPKEAIPDLFRVWTVLERERNYDPPMTADTRRVKQAWDPILDDSQRDCSPLGMPSAMMSPHPIEFVDQGEKILLRLEEWNGERTIYMTELDEDAIVKSRMGISQGHWEESTLVVKTTDIDYPYLDEYGIPQSPEVEVTERFSLREDGRHLDWSVGISDPLNFTEPFVLSTTTWHWLPGETIQPYDCEPLEDFFDG
jgi:hypothetical protein